MAGRFLGGRADVRGSGPVGADPSGGGLQPAVGEQCLPVCLVVQHARAVMSGSPRRLDHQVCPQGVGRIVPDAQLFGDP
jgi:hypothetical protein